jgi:hypothetical protein
LKGSGAEKNMFELYLALVVPHFTEAFRDRRALVLFLGKNLVCFRAKDCSVVATILPSTAPIRRDVVTSRLWFGAMSSSFDSSTDLDGPPWVVLLWGRLLLAAGFRTFVASYSFPPYTDRLPQSRFPVSNARLFSSCRSFMHACGPGENGALDLPAALAKGVTHEKLYRTICHVLWFKG